MAVTVSLSDKEPCSQRICLFFHQFTSSETFRVLSLFYIVSAAEICPASRSATTRQLQIKLETEL